VESRGRVIGGEQKNVPQSRRDVSPPTPPGEVASADEEDEEEWEEVRGG